MNDGRLPLVGVMRSSADTTQLWHPTAEELSKVKLKPEAPKVTAEVATGYDVLEVNVRDWAPTETIRFSGTARNVPIPLALVTARTTFQSLGAWRAIERTEVGTMRGGTMPDVVATVPADTDVLARPVRLTGNGETTVGVTVAGCWPTTKALTTMAVAKALNTIAQPVRQAAAMLTLA